MRLREHPELQPWPPTEVFALPPLPSRRDLRLLKIKNVRIKAPSRVELIFVYHGNCLWAKDLKDEKFLGALTDCKKLLIGKTLQDAGDVDIPV